MGEAFAAVVLIGLVCFVLVCVFDLLRAVAGFIGERQQARRNAQELHRRVQEWQSTLDYPLGHSDPTAPRDDPDDLGPLVEIWRRGG